MAGYWGDKLKGGSKSHAKRYPLRISVLDTAAVKKYLMAAE